MTTMHPHDLDACLERACSRIAPTWPLDRFVAVNPLWGFVDRPLPEAAADVAALAGARLVMPRAWYRDERAAGRLDDAHLQAAIDAAASSRDVGDLLATLERPAPDGVRRLLVTDVADARRGLRHGMAWREFVLHSLGQFCAAWFDEGQADLGPPREDGMYASWRRQAEADRAPGVLMDSERYPELVRSLPLRPRETIARGLDALEVEPAERERYLTALLLDVGGWAAWCAYRRWTARQEGRDDDALVQLLAIRLAWEWLLHRGGGRSLATRWRSAMGDWPACDRAAASAHGDDWLLQRAVEIAYSSRVAAGLRPAAPADDEAAARPDAQAVFCIDVRSEPLRRALESGSPGVRTLGFAGFFGAPLAYRPLAAREARPQVPGPLAPRLLATDTGASEGLAARRERRLRTAAGWRRLAASAVSTFSFVESFGAFAIGSLLRTELRRTRPGGDPERAGLTPDEDAQRRPRLTHGLDGAPLGPDDRVDLAEGILRSMSLTRGFARLVALVGHAARANNNPHAAGLDCGACCGQSGEVNARAVAALLNDDAVRRGLAARGIAVPGDSRFVAALHVTTTDEIELFDLDEVPDSHRPDVASLSAAFAAAGRRVRAERAGRLGLAHLDGERLDAAISARAADWSQVRPEWGLARNAAFIAAPRERTRHLDLDGRAFLHEYRWREDAGFDTLETIMTAPLVVAHWINFQYYASTVDNDRYGSGNKVLHNVVGGHIGVFEGNGGDLRIGLPMQSVHDGARWVHEPLRLQVFLEAPRHAIEAVLRSHETVRHLVDNEWIFLFQIDDGRGDVAAYRNGAWTPVRAAEPLAEAGRRTDDELCVRS